MLKYDGPVLSAVCHLYGSITEALATLTQGPKRRFEWGGGLSESVSKDRSITIDRQKVSGTQAPVPPKYASL